MLHQNQLNSSKIGKLEKLFKSYQAILKIESLCIFFKKIVKSYQVYDLVISKDDFYFHGKVRQIENHENQNVALSFGDFFSRIFCLKCLFHFSNLRSIPTLGASVPTPMNQQGQPRITKTGGQSNRVMISNLPRNMSFARVSAMTTACGNVRNINVNENGTAIVEFANPAGAENFIRTNNRKIIDRSQITVSRLA